MTIVNDLIRILNIIDRSWELKQIFHPDYLSDGDQFGFSVSISNDFFFIGANEYDSKGAVYIFNKEDFSFHSKLSPYEDYSSFGTSISVDENIALIGASGSKEKGIYYSGAAYFYEIGFSCNGSTFGCGNDDQGYCSNTDVCICNH